MTDQGLLRTVAVDDQRTPEKASNTSPEATDLTGDYENSIVTAYRLKTQAGTLQRQGHYDQAESLYRRIIALYEQTYGPDHPSTATSLYDLTELFKAQERYGEAEPLLRRLLAIREKTYGVGHPETLADFNNLVWVLRLHAIALTLRARQLKDQGGHREAEPLFRRALALVEENPNVKSCQIGNLLDDLAEVLRAQGRHTDAELFYRRALALQERIHGAEHPRTACSLHPVAAVLQDQGRLVEAELLLRQALAINEKACGLDHPDTATGLYHLVEVLRAQGRTAEANQLFRRALGIQRKALNSEHSRTVASRNPTVNAPCIQKDLIGSSPLPEPLLPGEWRWVPAFGQKRVFDKLKLEHTLEDPGLLNRLSNLYALELPFYPYAVLYEGEVETAISCKGRQGRFAFIRCRQRFTVLDGNSQPIQALNAFAPLRLEIAAQALAYLRFHCAAIQRKAGTFRIVEQLGDLHWPAATDATLRTVTEQALKPLVIHSAPNNTWRAEGAVLCGKRLHVISWRIMKNGQIDIIDDQPQGVELPIASPRFVSAVRYMGG